MSEQINKSENSFSDDENLKDLETGENTEDVDYALPFDKDGKSRVKNTVVFDDIDDYIFQNPVKVKSGNHYKRKKKHLKKWQKAVLSILLVLVVLVGGLISTLLIMTNMGKNQLLENNSNTIIDVPENIQDENDGKIITYNGRQYKFNENVTSILCMGIDRETLAENTEDYGDNGDADVLFLVSIDTESGKTNLVSISRDTMAEIDTYSTEGNYSGTKNQQICLAYAYGNGKETSCENQVAAVRRMFYNVPINSYFAIDLSAIGQLNDAIGGVTVTSLETFGDFVKDKKVTLYGDMAESYVRYRDTSVLESNNTRMERQKQYIQSFFSQFVYKTKMNMMTPLDLFNTASPYMVTNIDASEVTYLASNFLQKNFSELNMQNVPGELKQGEVYAEYYIDEDKFFEMFLDIFYTPMD